MLHTSSIKLKDHKGWGICRKRQLIYQDFLNYRQIIRNKKLNFEIISKIIDIRKSMKFDSIIHKRKFDKKGHSLPYGYGTLF